MKQIEGLLRERIGLDAASIGSTLIERTVRLRMKSLGSKSLHDYKRLLHSSPTEWEALVEAVVVTETWFFRDKEPFQVLAQQVQLDRMRTQNGGLLRALSVPCSSGEEPYSLAMALLDGGVPKERFLIDAVDISAHALARAQRAVYGKNSFRGKDLDFRHRHFQPTQDGYVLRPEVRACVNFFRDNLLSDGFMAGQTFYDVVFCRNLLIYFDRATQVKSLEKVHRVLSPTGLLFVGPAEMPLVLDCGFVSLNLPMAFACRKATPEAARPARYSRVVGPAGAPLSSAKAGRIATTPAHRQPHSYRSNSAPTHNTDLNAAQRLADAGKLKEATEICEAHLHVSGPTAQAYYLLGLIRDAHGDPLAIEFYRKALYLNETSRNTVANDIAVTKSRQHCPSPCVQTPR